MGWLFLSSAVLFEVSGTIALKYSEGMTKVCPSVFMILFYLLSIIAFGYALTKMDVSLAYALWSGLGTVLIASVGVFYFEESISAIKVMSIALIVIGVIGLQMNSST